MTNEQTPPGTRVRAAKAILEMALRAPEVDDLTSRVAELKRQTAYVNAPPVPKTSAEWQKQVAAAEE